MKPNHDFSIFPWQGVANYCTNRFPMSKVWNSSHPENLEKGSKVIFFIDLEIICLQLEELAVRFGYTTVRGASKEIILVSNGQFEENISVKEIAFEAIWTTESIETVLVRRTNSLSDTFTAYERLYQLLCKTFRDCSFWRVGSEVHALWQQTHGLVDYNALWRAMQSSKMKSRDWLSRLSPTDLFHINEPMIALIRSKTFQKAWPDALVEEREGYLITCERDKPKFRLITKREDDPNLRLAHCIDEAKRYASTQKFDARIFVTQYAPRFGAALVGRHVSSLLLYPEALSSALREFENVPKSLRALAKYEDTLIVCDPKTPEHEVAELLGRAKLLMDILYEDGSDSLNIDTTVKLESAELHIVQSHPVPLAFFDLMETAEDKSLKLPSCRSDYLRGLAYEIIHETKLAASIFRRAYKADRNDGDIAHAFGRALSEIGKHKEALPILERANDLLPQDPDVSNSLGLAYLECRNNTDAVRALEHAVEVAPDDVHFLSNLGRCYLADARLRDAELVLTRALEYAPNFSDALATLAQIRWRLGDLRAAKVHARKAFAANPSNKCVQDLLWALSIDEAEKKHS